MKKYSIVKEIIIETSISPQFILYFTSFNINTGNFGSKAISLTTDFEKSLEKNPCFR